MDNAREFQLQDIIEISEFKRILNSFVIATGLGAIYISADGQSEIVPDEYDGYCPYCKIVRSSPEGKKRCIESMGKAGKLAADLGEPYISRCHAGLIEFAAPIMFKDIYLGSISCAPVLMWEWDETAVEEFLNLTNDLDIDKNALIEASKGLPILSSRKVQAAANLLFIIANYIAKYGMITLQQRKELSDQQAKLAELIFDKKQDKQRIELLENRANSHYYPMDKETELLNRVRMGDRSGARKILNEILSDILLHSAGNLELIKARVLELVVVISRAAVEGGAVLNKLLGLNYSFISELSSLNVIEDICMWIVKVLDTFMDTVYESRSIKNSKLLSDALAYIREHYREDLTLDLVAQRVYISPYYLSHLFKEELGITFVEYLTKIRVDEAKKLLYNQDLSISNIASNVGYNDSGYFSKVFKKTTGISPSYYRNNL